MFTVPFNYLKIGNNGYTTFVCSEETKQFMFGVLLSAYIDGGFGLCLKNEKGGSHPKIFTR